MQLADLHIHLLPGVDDGPTDWETTERMLAEMAAWGVKLVAPTPHVRETDWSDPQTKLFGLAELKQLANRHGIQVIGAAELWAIPDLPERWQKVLPLTYGGSGKYALVEFDVAEMPLFAEWLLFQMKVRGVTPIIAHPERYLWVQEDERNLFRLLGSGALVQVGVDALLLAGTPMGKTAWWLLRNGLVDFLASDWHSLDLPYPLAQGVQKLKGEISSEQVERLVWGTPRRIASGQLVQPAWMQSPLHLDIQAFLSGIQRPQRRHWWQFLLLWPFRRR